MAIKKYSDYAKENNIEYKVNHIGNVSQYLKQKSSQSVKKEETKRKWLNKGSFNDGYQFGDITKTTAGTVGDIGTNLLKGVVKAGESIGDVAAYAGAQVVDWFGADNYAKEVRKAAAESLTDKLFSKVDKVVDKNSVLGEKSDNVVESIGNMYAQGVTSNKLLGTKGNIPLNVAGKKFNLPATSVISGASAGMSEAVNKDAEDWQIWLNGIKSGVTEGVSESLFGTFGIGGSDLDDAIVKGITKNMENGLAKTLAKSGIKAIGEGTEEIVSYLLDYASSHIGDYAKNTLKLKGPDLAEKFSSEELWESFFAGTLAAGFGGLPSTINSIKGNTINLNVNEGINQFNKVNLPGLNQSTKNLPINSLGQQPTTDTNNEKQVINKNVADIQNNNNIKNSIFSKQVDEVLNGTFNKENHMTVLEHTPEVLQKLGVKDYPITLTVNKMDRIVNESGNQKGEYHGLGVETIKKIPQALQNPLDIVKSHNNSYVLTTDLSDSQNRQVIASIKIDGKGYIDNIEIDTNVMTSAYGRNNYDSWMKTHQDNGDIIYDIDRGYINTKKLDTIPRLQLPNNNIKYSKSDANDRFQLPMRGSSSSTTTSDIPKNISPISYDNNITQLDENVKLPSINNMQENTDNIPVLRNSDDIRTSTKDNELPIQRDEKSILPKDPTKASSYEDDIEVEKLAKILEERPTTIEEKDNWLKKLIATKIMDKGYYVDKLARKTKNRELSAKYDYMLMSNGIAQQIIGNEQYNPKTQKSNGKGLHQIFEPIENSGQLQEFSEYMYHKHNVSRMSLNSLYNEDNKPIFGNSITSETSEQIVKNYEENNPEFEKWAQEIYNYNNFLLDMLVDYDVISVEDKKYYNKKYPYYVPTIRNVDRTSSNIDVVRKKASVNLPIKKAKGSNKDIIPLKEAMALRTMQTVNSALRNNFGNELLDTLEIEATKTSTNLDEVMGDDIDTEDLLVKSSKKNPASLTIFKNGKKLTFEINDEIYDALVPSVRKTSKFLNKFSQLRRALLTEYNPTFMLTNPIKDVQDGTLNSKHSTLFVKNITEAVAQIKNKGAYYKLYLANGGSYETYFNYGEGYNNLPKNKSKWGPRGILDKISNINQSIEMTPRLAEFISSLEAGDSIETAMYNAQEITTNFKRGGNWTKNLDANGFTFLNASVQGTVKQIRNFQDAKTEGVRGMTRLAVKWAVAGIPAILLSELIWGDDEDYEELSDYVKNNYYLLWKNEDGKFVRIPKGRVTSVIQNLFSQSFDAAFKKEKIDINEFIDLLQTQVLPSNPEENNIFSPLMQAVNNKTWYGGDLVPQRLESLPAEEQFDESTDGISKWLGKKLGISPIKINYVLDQYSGVLGDMILPTLTLEAENDSNSALSILTSPLKDKFMTDSVMNNQNISDLYELDEKLTKKAKSSNATEVDKLKSKYINAIQTEMNELTKEKRNIQNDKTLSNNEKYKQVKEIQKKINKLAKEGINNYNNVDSYDNYAKVADKEYFLNSKNEWEKLSKDELEDIEKLKLSNEDKDKYFSAKVKINKISSNKDITSEEKHLKIADELINSSLNEDSIINLYSKKYSTEDKLNYIKALNIPIKKFIELNSQNIDSEYDVNTGKTINGSKKQNYIKAVNNLQLSIPQKAILIKMQYPTYNNYNKEIVTYVNKINTSKSEKQVLLKAIGFDNYSKEVVNYINSQNISKIEKEKKLKSLGFTIRNGRVYW